MGAGGGGEHATDRAEGVLGIGTSGGLDEVEGGTYTTETSGDTLEHVVVFRLEQRLQEHRVIERHIVEFLVAAAVERQFREGSNRIVQTGGRHAPCAN